MRITEEHNEKPKATKATVKPTTMLDAKSTKKSCTTILCELTRLKTQQKYLECNQVKLCVDNFSDNDSVNVTTSKQTSNKNNGLSSQVVMSLIAEIEQLKEELHTELCNYRDDAQREIQDMWVFVNAIKEDIFQPERLRQFSMQIIRERILGINSQLERLKTENANKLRSLQDEYAKLEKETKILIK